MSEKDEGGFLHDKEGTADCVHLAGVRVALSLHTQDVVDLQEILGDQSLQDLSSQLAEGEQNSK